MRALSFLCLGLALSLFQASPAAAVGALATCTGPSGLTVEVDLQRGTMRISLNQQTTGWNQIFHQELSPAKEVVLAAGNPDNPAILVLNDKVGSVSTFVMGERQIQLTCR